MARRKDIGSAGPAAADQQPPTDRDASVTTATFVGYYIRKASFEETGTDFSPKAATSEAFQISLRVTVAVNEDGTETDVTMGMSVIQGPGARPYRVNVDLVGVFRVSPGNPSVLGEFGRKAAPTILYPFVREIVRRLTTDARFGPVNLDPINLRTLKPTSSSVSPSTGDDDTRDPARG